jgi:hypothetical protein
LRYRLTKIRQQIQMHGSSSEHYKFYNPPADVEIISDKWAVREVVKNRVGEPVLNDAYYVGTDLDAIPWDTLP